MCEVVSLLLMCKVEKCNSFLEYLFIRAAYILLFLPLLPLLPNFLPLLPLFYLFLPLLPTFFTSILRWGHRQQIKV